MKKSAVLGREFLMIHSFFNARDFRLLNGMCAQMHCHRGMQDEDYQEVPQEARRWLQTASSTTSRYKEEAQERQVGIEEETQGKLKRNLNMSEGAC